MDLLLRSPCGSSGGFVVWVVQLGVDCVGVLSRGVDLKEWCHALLDVAGVVEPIPWVQYVGKGAARVGDRVVEGEKESLFLLLSAFPLRGLA